MDPDLLKFAGVMLTFATVGLGGYTAIRVINLVLGRLESKASPALAAELDELRARVEELEVERGRLVELEERVDFTERVLAADGQGRKLEAPS